MIKFFLEGGAGMYPVALFGFGFVAVAVLHALRPDRRLSQGVIGLGALTLGAGVLGLTMGINSTMTYLHQVKLEEQVSIGAAGIAESSNDLILAMVLFMLGALAATVGGFRARKLA